MISGVPLPQMGAQAVGEHTAGILQLWKDSDVNLFNACTAPDGVFDRLRVGDVTFDLRFFDDQTREQQMAARDHADRLTFWDQHAIAVPMLKLHSRRLCRNRRRGNRQQRQRRNNEAQPHASHPDPPSVRQSFERRPSLNGAKPLRPSRRWHQDRATRWRKETLANVRSCVKAQSKPRSSVWLLLREEEPRVSRGLFPDATKGSGSTNTPAILDVVAKDTLHVCVGRSAQGHRQASRSRGE